VQAERYLRDVYLYVTSREVQRQINAIVEEKLTDEHTLVIAHSLGAVVAYSVVVNNRRKTEAHQIHHGRIAIGSVSGQQQTRRAVESRGAKRLI
jgi:hypothetical protein